ncbi:MAG: hypothetical protein V7K89_06550, partial [Nostoc sp.]|uniref:hypothetical protein n=1 Tax=Nostoc sp. TaxID=1180 RepID=UPI002FF5DEC4
MTVLFNTKVASRRISSQQAAINLTLIFSPKSDAEQKSIFTKNPIGNGWSLYFTMVLALELTTSAYNFPVFGATRWRTKGWKPLYIKLPKDERGT